MLLLIIIIAVLLIAGNILMPSKGKLAEMRVHNKLAKLSDEHQVFDDVLFKSNGKSTQIDHIVVSPYGVFIIETKGYKGRILGGEYAEYWTQNIYGEKYQFYNPIRQNEGHIRFLSYLMRDLGQIPMIPIVVFNNKADIKVNTNEHIVINRVHLTQAILSYKTIVLSDEQIHNIVRPLRTIGQWTRNLLNSILIPPSRNRIDLRATSEMAFALAVEEL